MTKIRAVFGAAGQFVLFAGRPYWMPVNDADYDHVPKLGGEFVIHDEAFYLIDGNDVSFELPDNVRLFSEEARRLEEKRLQMLALEDLAKNLRAAQAEYGLEQLISKIDFYLKQEDMFDR
ncbi:hypothetical protein [Neisseria iguanae]|uniref:Uncharacterized protein n=1 Tax=Neisseria iguanae TaxID=90242 RepID=A0A2P7U3J2_9NEIS|nr:hypothetical protein [Neisseria iguanae]PSJ81517.1 hypothetical protein C7N83_00035 [Neisseria iguanae]